MSETTKKKPAPRAAKTLQKVSVAILKDDLAKKALPTLLDVLLPIYEDGTMTRQPGRLSIVPDGGSWRLTIECPTEGLQATLMLDSLPTLFDESERLLAGGSVRWGESWKKRRKALPEIDAVI